ncbi:MAG: MerR family transcriptional regulator [Simplicispira sp.]|nr:MerR family transcriptional regulator [Simplicispira sp.]
MNDRERALAQHLSIATVERDTGLSKDTLRVWERRYGFPSPERDGAGDRLYPPEQVERLHAIRRLMDAGHRPGRIVALAPEALAALANAAPAAPMAPAGAPAGAPALENYLALIAQHDVHRLRRALSQDALRLGLVVFVSQLVAPLNRAVGEAWIQGRFQIFEEHLYTECLTGVLRQTIASIAPPQGRGAPRVLLTTVPQEPHGLGLLMVEALLALEGCHCLSLGPQTPLADIARAAQVHGADIVALSFTAVQAAPTVLAALRALRRQLPPGTALWVGGQCPVLYQRPLPGVLPVQDIAALPAEVARWRSAAAGELGSEQKVPPALMG